MDEWEPTESVKREWKRVAIESVRGRPGLGGLSEEQALLIASAYRWLELYQMAGWKLRPLSVEMSRDEYHQNSAINGEIFRIATELRKQADSFWKPATARRLLAMLVRLTDDRYRGDGRHAFQPFIDTLHAIEVELAMLPRERNTKRRMTPEQAHALLRDWEAEKRADPGGGKTIAEKWKPRLIQLGASPAKVSKDAYGVMRNLLRHARIVVGKD